MIFETIKNQSQLHRHKTAVICGDKKYTYTELIESVEKLAAVMSTAFLPGDRLLFASGKEYHYIRMVLACDILGVTFMPTFPNLPKDVVDGIVEASSPDHIILTEADALALEPHNKALIYSKKTDHTYTVLFTSGTTGKPKAVAHTSAGCLMACFNSISVYQISSNDVILSQLPPSTVGGLYLYALPGLIKGCTVVIEQFNPRRFVKLCEEYKPTIGIIVPAMILAMQNLKTWNELDMSHWRELSVGSTIIPEEMLDILFSKGVPAIRDLYGCTETQVPAFTFLIEPDTEHKLQLECNDQYEYKLDRHDQLWLKSPLLMSNYLNADAELDSDGFWCTGDVFERKYNKLFYKSRRKDLMKINSHNVSPIGIENAILVLDGVDEVCVISKERGLGEKYIVAIISSQDPQINKSLVMNSIESKLMPYELPKDIIVTKETLPRNQMGKIQRHVIQGIYGEVNEDQS